ncbi:SusF/SusE family outer membrane protein [Flavisolibacter sp. BT320]|nr:SusF/SusE family outer membrane protein [Flavisolibacter longurius]
MAQIHFSINKSINIIQRQLQGVFVFVLLALTAGCSKELKAPEPAPLDPGVLTASKTDVIINSSAPGDEAIKFSWGTFPNTMISYSLVLSANNKSDTTNVAANAISRSFTNSQLNTILLTKLGLSIGTAADVRATVIAAVPVNGKTATTNAITIKMTPAATGPSYNRLWIVGSATPNGWNIDNPNEMSVDSSNLFQFKYNEVLNAGEFKIPVTTGNWGADFFMPAVNHQPLSNTAVQLIPGGNPDNKWEITTPGAYKILLNISANPSIKITPFTPFAGLYLVGDATPAGWNIDNPTPMTAIGGDPYTFTWTGPLKEGEFKIPTTTGNWGTDYFMPLTDQQGIYSKLVKFVPGGNPDHKWRIATAGTYRITINQLKETISIVKL